MDTAVVVAIVGLIGTLVTVVIGAFVAVNLNRTEKHKVAEDTLEATLRERITLRDEKIMELNEDLQECSDLNDAKDFVIRELRKRLEETDEQHK